MDHNVRSNGMNIDGPEKNDIRNNDPISSKWTAREYRSETLEIFTKTNLILGGFKIVLSS